MLMTVTFAKPDDLGRPVDRNIEIDDDDADSAMNDPEFFEVPADLKGYVVLGAEPAKEQPKKKKGRKWI